MKAVVIDPSALQLQGTLFEPTATVEKHPAILFVHGWTSRQDRMFDLAAELAAHGYVCLTFDMRGHGISPGDLNNQSRKDFLDDVIAAYDFLASVPCVDGFRITVAGSSFGGYMSALLSAVRTVQQIILRVPADYRDEGYELPLSEVRNRDGTFEWKRIPHDKTETAALRAMHVYTGRVLIGNWG